MDNIRNAIHRIPGIYKSYRSLKRTLKAINVMKSPFLQSAPPGHFYSPLPDIEQVLDREGSHFKHEISAGKSRNEAIRKTFRSFI